jgi:hydroxymethylpyrimidine/phosphomethylpyrimidine kinase
VATHGTGCTYSAAVTALLARGYELRPAVELAKRHITRAIAQSQRAGRHPVLNFFPR